VRGRGSAGGPRETAAAGGFTLIEVLVALVIVALGMSALLETLSASANNISALRDKTVAEWIAMNQIANTRLALKAPSIGITDGEVSNCAEGNWHWQQRVTAVDAVPGLLSITVSVRRTGAAAQGSGAGNSGNSTASGTAGATSGGLGAGSSGALGSSSIIVGCTATSGPGSSLGSTGALGAGGSIGAGASLGATASIGPSGGIGPGTADNAGNSGSAGPDTAGSPGAAGASTAASITALLGANTASGGKGQDWLITLTGFRGNSLSAATGEIPPDWNGSTFAGESGPNGIPNGAVGGGVIQNSPSRAATP
jgi:type II secretion system protein I